MSVSIQESYDYCRNVARKRAKNFYYSFADNVFAFLCLSFEDGENQVLFA